MDKDITKTRRGKKPPKDVATSAKPAAKRSATNKSKDNPETTRAVETRFNANIDAGVAAPSAGLPSEAQAKADLKAQNDRYKGDHPTAKFDCSCAVGTLDGDPIFVGSAYHVACQRLGDQYNTEFDGKVIVDVRMS